jgi:hypothetical protein
LSENPKGMWVDTHTVRKHEEHGAMLPTEGPNRRMYVYVGPETLAEKVDPSHQNRHSWIEYIAAASGIIATLGFLTYGLGLLSLISLTRTTTSTAVAS